MSDSFARLKKDLVFHEKRMQLLLSSRVVEDLQACLAEKSQVRFECAADCRDSLQKFERGAAEPRLSGRWDELKVATLFQLDVPLRYVVGSTKFEAPEGQDTAQLEALITRLQSMSERYPEFDHEHAGRNTETLIDFIRTVKFTGRDVTRMREAVTSKLEVLSELDDLAKVLQDSGFTVSRIRAQLEDLRRQEDQAARDGETATSEAIMRDRIDLLGKVIDTTFFQTHTIESSIEANVARRKSNIAQFQSSAAMIACIKTEKQELATGCEHDVEKIRRGMLFESGSKDSGRSKILERQKQSADRIASLDARQKKLSQRLKELFDEFTEVEGALQRLGDERAEAVAAHIDLVENNRHATSDFIELSKFADQYVDNLASTKAQYDEGLDALHLFEKVLLQEQDFAKYNFNASGSRLQTMRRSVCKDLNAALNELRDACGELVRRRNAQIRQIDESRDVAVCELEIRKDMLDPAAARYAGQVRELDAAKARLQGEIDQINGIVARHETTCLELLRKHLGDDEFADNADARHVRDLQSRERVADLRSSIVQSREAHSSEASVSAIKSQMTRANQTGAPAATPPILQAPLSSDSDALLSPGTERRVLPSGMNRSRVAESLRSRSSRVTAVREEIAQALANPYPASTSPPPRMIAAAGGDAAPSKEEEEARAVAEDGGRPDAARSKEQDEGRAAATTSATAAQRRPIRVIGATTSNDGL